MFRTSPEKPEQERGSLETCPPGLRQSLAYILHLRSHWKPEGRTKLIVPTSWMEFLTLADGKCGMECAAVQHCPFRNVRFESVAKARLVVPDEELPRNIVSQLLTNFGMDGCLATFVPRAFDGIPRTSTRSDVPEMSHARSQSALWRIDFGLVSEHDAFPENETRCLLLGMKESFQIQRPSAFDPCSPLTSIPEELTSHGRFHLTLLASLMKRGVAETTEHSGFPEWLVLFGLAYDARRIRVIAYLPHRCKMDVIGCAAYIVDELPLRSSPGVASVPTCELVLERLRLLLALTALRRHVLHLSKSLFSVIDPCDGVGRISNNPSHPSLLTCDQHDFESLQGRGSLGSSSHSSNSEYYLTCPSSVRARESNDVPAFECGEELSSPCKSFACSFFCSTCSSLLGSNTISDSFYSEDSKYTNSDHMEPSTIAFSQDNEGVTFACPNKLAVTKRRAIIAWAREVIPTEHDTYKMIVRHPHGRRGLADSKSSTRT